MLIARDSETLEEKVVYKEVDGESAYVRSLPMFVSLVDKEKYPNVTQEFRFELVQGAEVLQRELHKRVTSTEMEDAEQKVQIADHDMIMEYLELSDANERIEYLLQVKDRISEEFISVVAQSLDFAENKGELQERYDAILRFLRTVARYESGRLR